MSNARPPRAASTFVRYATLFGALFVTRASLADQYTVPSGSMEPTVHTGDRVVVDKVAYGLRVPATHLYITRFHGPVRGDVVVLDSPEKPMVLLKRVVAVGGDRVAVRGGVVVVDGVPEASPPPFGAWGGDDFGPVVVPPGHALVLGDNRGNSHDGRDFGFVAYDAILGRVEAVVAREGALTWQRVE